MTVFVRTWRRHLDVLLQQALELLGRWPRLGELGHRHDHLGSAGTWILALELPLSSEVLRGVFARRGELPREGTADLEHLMDHAVVALPLKEDPARGQLEQGQAGTPDINLHVVGLAKEDFWCSVEPRLDAVRADPLRHFHGAAKVGEFDRRLVHRNEEIVGLHVAMDNVHLAQGAQRFEYVPSVALNRGERQAAALAVLMQP
mmetsp:Transcript_19011/g.43167  ORF Transcript_19011/g.43167 Transcript_19011/m.43167 type:complete len:203 (-) Transcript_19011:1111-1719(-)